MSADESRPSDDGNQVLARIERPTGDGKAHYVFEFTAVNGAVATAIGMPAGYPAVEPGACALDTFLRVAPDDAIVPVEIRRACAAPGATIDPAPVRVAELRPSGAAFEPPSSVDAAATGPYCTKAPYDARYEQLVSAASYQAKRIISVDVCDLSYTYDMTGCRLWEPDGDFFGLCDPAQIPPPGDGPPECFLWHTTLSSVPNPACAHDIVSWGTYGPWLDWEWVTPFGVSQLQAEVSVCDPNGTSVFYWQMRRKESAPYSDPVHVVLYGASYWIFTLDSGTWNGDWSGARYLVHASGPGVFPMLAGAIMEGIDRSDCPTHLFL